MRKQHCASGGKTVKLGEANTLQVGCVRLSALRRVRGEWTDAGRSVHSLSVDWQAWGTKGGLCWRATRDGLRHVPAGPPKSRCTENISTSGPTRTHQPVGKPRYSARTRTILLQYVCEAIPGKTAQQIAPSNRNPLSRCAPSAGAGKNAPLPSRGIFARGALGVGFEVGVRQSDSHALSNTWESVQKTGLGRS
jgi:hypothetical protein